MALQVLRCNNGGEVYEREAARGRRPTSCVKHEGTGIPVKSYRKGSATGERALTKYNESGHSKAFTPGRLPVVKAAPPRAVPVRVVENSRPMQQLTCSYNGHTWERVPTRGTKPLFCPDHRAVKPEPEEDDEDPVIEVKGEYVPDTTVEEQRTLLYAVAHPESTLVGPPEQPKRRKRVQAAALQAPVAAPEPTTKILPDPDSDDSEEAHQGEFWCEPGEHWHPRKSNRGQAPRVCDDHNDDEYKRQQRVTYSDAAATRGEETADRLIRSLRDRGLHLSQQADEFEVQMKWAGRWSRWLTLHGEKSKRLWLSNDDNAAMVNSQRFRIRKIATS